MECGLCGRGGRIGVGPVGCSCVEGTRSLGLLRPCASDGGWHCCAVFSAGEVEECRNEMVALVLGTVFAVWVDTLFPVWKVFHVWGVSMQRLMGF